MTEAFDWDRAEAIVAGCGTLEELFDQWKKAHEAEKQDSTRQTFPKRKGQEPPEHHYFCKSFCPDGYLTEPAEGPCDILFVFREANCSKDGMICPNHVDYFWMQDIYQKGKDPTGKYLPFIRKWVKKIEPNGSVACMDLNKRGGYGECNHSRLKHYVDRYEAFLQKQIEIIQPKVIICGGTGGHVERLLSKPVILEEEPVLIKVYHPAARKKADGK